MSCQLSAISLQLNRGLLRSWADFSCANPSQFNRHPPEQQE